MTREFRPSLETQRFPESRGSQAERLGEVGIEAKATVTVDAGGGAEFGTWFGGGGAGDFEDGGAVSGR